MIDFQLRPATRHDFAIIVSFVQAMLSEMYGPNTAELSDAAEAWLDFERRVLQTLSGTASNRSHYADAGAHLLDMAHAIDGEEFPLGLIEAHLLRPTPIFRPEQTLYIHALYVRPEYRQHGVGTALLCAALDWGRQHQCLRAQLTALPHNPARRLYRELGFTTDGLELRRELVPAHDQTQQSTLLR
jgi:GNAT superfamily N-acetyltransferase